MCSVGRNSVAKVEAEKYMLEILLGSFSFPVCIKQKPQTNDTWLLSLFIYWGQKFKAGFIDALLLNAIL